MIRLISMRGIPLFALMLILVLSSACSMIGGLPKTPEVDYQATITALENKVEAILEQEAAQPEISDNPTPEVEIIPTATPVVESLPSEPVPASVPIIYDGWSMAVSQELKINSNFETWGILVYLTNLGSNQRVFRFTNSAVTATDNLGNVYAPSWKSLNLSDTYCEPYHYVVKNLSVDGEDSVEIKADDFWSGCDNEDGLNMFRGPIPIEVEQLYIHFDGFGPYNGITVVIDL